MEFPEELKKLLKAAGLDLDEMFEQHAIATKIANSVTKEQAQKLSEMVERAIGGDSADASVGSVIVECLANLSKDKWWEPSRLPTEDNAAKNYAALHQWDDQTPGRVKDRFMGLTLQLRGDTPACSLTWHDLLEDARHYWQMEIRNAVREWMVENKVIANTDPLA